LSSEKVTKRDMFHVFHSYGDLAQISIKQAYGFVQFLRTEDCTRALNGEQGTQIKDKRIRKWDVANFIL
jgi:nuclear polyadenylated RNA-binding protein 3